MGVTIDAVFDPSARRREAARRAVPAARVYERLDLLLAAEKSLDALIVCSPPAFHAGAVVSGLQAGLHVLCEKPLTLDSAAFADIADAAEKAARAAYTVNNWAFSPQWSRLLETAALGKLGTIRQADIRVLRAKPSASALPGDWRKDPEISGGGILVDHGWHNLYLMRRLLGDELDLTRTVLQPAGGVDEVAVLTLQAPAAAGTIHLSWRADGRSNSVFVAGDKGTAELNDDVLIVKAGGKVETVSFAQKLSGGSAHPDWLVAMWPAFEAACADGAGNLAEAHFCLKTIRSAYGAEEPAAR